MKSIALTISLFILFSGATLSGLSQAATTRYVSDKMEITLRTGMSNQHEILRLIPSGTALTVLDDSDRNYTKVRTPGGTEGWVLNRYLMDTPSARERLASAEQKMAQLSEEVKQLREQLATNNKDKSQTEQERNNLNEQNSILNRELANIRRTAANAVQIADENQRLKTRVAEMEQGILMLQQENDSLGDRSRRNWFMTGAVVVIISMLFGIMLTRIRWRKKSSWGEL